MGKRIIKLTESDLERIVRRVIKENYRVGDIVNTLKDKGFEVDVKKGDGSMFTDDRFNETLVSQNYDITVYTSNDDEKLDVWEFISNKNANNININDDGSMSFGFKEIERVRV